MNSTDWLNVMSQVPALVTNIEQVYPQKGTGLQKLAAVTSVILPLVPTDQVAKVMPAVSGWIGAIVALYNLVGFFNHGSPAVMPMTASESPPAEGSGS